MYFYNILYVSYRYFLVYWNYFNHVASCFYRKKVYFNFDFGNFLITVMEELSSCITEVDRKFKWIKILTKKQFWVWFINLILISTIKLRNLVHCWRRDVISNYFVIVKFDILRLCEEDWLKIIIRSGLSVRWIVSSRSRAEVLV